MSDTVTEEFKARVDNMPLVELLRGWRHTPFGHPDFRLANGKYWSEVMGRKRAEEGPEAWTTASKEVGWEE